MTTFLRRVRGVIGTALVWAGGWLLMMMPPLLYLLRNLDTRYSGGLAIGGLLYLIAAWGAATGTIFALGLIVLGRRRRWGGLSLPRAIGLGVFAGAAVPLSLGFWWWLMLSVDLPETLAGATLSAVMGGMLAATTLVVARLGEATAFPPEKEQRALIDGE